VVEFEGFLAEVEQTKEASAKAIAKVLGLMGAGAAVGAGGTHVLAEKKRKSQLKQLADLFRQANIQENRLIAQRAFQAGRKS